MNKDELIVFEEEIKTLFNSGQIAAPVHLAGGNEDQLIALFKNIWPNDWIIGTWRSHYHCLLKGVPPEQLKKKIIEGRSIGLCFPEHRILCSAMVGGNAPLAVGIAWGIKEKRVDEKVWCFLGDMGATTGIVHEAMQYARGHNLPITFVVENNRYSVGAKTEETWGTYDGPRQDRHEYLYEINVPHVGTGSWSGL